MIQTVLVVGSGTMGSAIGVCAAVAGYRVIYYDNGTDFPQKIKQRTNELLSELLSYQLISASALDPIRSRLDTSADLRAAASSADLIIEAIYENLEAKQKIFKELDMLAGPFIPILSNTSGLRITDISSQMRHPERTLAAHFWLPAHLIPLVEIVIGEKSSPELAERIKEILTGWGKTPVIVKKDLPGQLANRILQAVIREAVNIVEIGLASPEDVDKAVQMGMALRFPVWGPLEHVDAVGFDICKSVQDAVLPEISDRKQASPLFAEMMSAGCSGVKSGEGFYNWSKRDINALIKRRNDFIVFAIKQINQSHLLANRELKKE
jgi:3-hydroxybutyryl-CoA dehydrogenase